MPTWLKVTLILVAVSIALLIATIFVGFHAVQRISGSAKQSMADGDAFGRGKEVSACIDEAVARATTRCAKNDAFCLMQVQMFLMRCMETSNVPADFCSSIPERVPFALRNRWAADECARRGHAGDSRCKQMMETVQLHCSSKR